MCSRRIRRAGHDCVEPVVPRPGRAMRLHPLHPHPAAQQAAASASRRRRATRQTSIGSHCSIDPAMSAVRGPRTPTTGSEARRLQADACRLRSAAAASAFRRRPTSDRSRCEPDDCLGRATPASGSAVTTGIVSISAARSSRRRTGRRRRCGATPQDARPSATPISAPCQTNCSSAQPIAWAAGCRNIVVNRGHHEPPGVAVDQLPDFRRAPRPWRAWR